MKKLSTPKVLAASILVMVIVMCATKCHAQLYTDAGIGTDFKHAVATWNVGIEAQGVTAEAFITPSLTRNVSASNFLGVKVGYNILSGLPGDPSGVNLIPSIGYYYDHVSSDKKRLNTSHAGYSLKYIKQVSERGYLFANAAYVGGVVQVTTGIHYKF